tara:strand:+ start:11108 stop:11395 length:288 start_codon:yes stop_codon:yes gene_type:complete
MSEDQEQITLLAFSWAAFGAAETLLHAVSTNSKAQTSCASCILDFIVVGKLGLPAQHYVDKTAELYPNLALYRAKANRLLEKMVAERSELPADRR